MRLLMNISCVVLLLLIFFRTAYSGFKNVTSVPLDVVIFFDETRLVRGYAPQFMKEWIQSGSLHFNIGLAPEQTRVGIVSCYDPHMHQLNRPTMSAAEVGSILESRESNWQYGDHKIERCFRLVGDMFKEELGDRATVPNVAIGLVYPEYEAYELESMKDSFNHMKARTTLILLVAVRKFGRNWGTLFMNWEGTYNQPMKNFMAANYLGEKYYIVASNKEDVPPRILYFFSDSFLVKYVQDCIVSRNETECKIENGMCQKYVVSVIEVTPEPGGKPCNDVFTGYRICNDTLSCCENLEWEPVSECNATCGRRGTQKIERKKTGNLDIEKVCTATAEMDCTSPPCQKEVRSDDNVVVVAVAVTICLAFFIICVMIVFVVFITRRRRKSKKKAELKQSQFMELTPSSTVLQTKLTPKKLDKKVKKVKTKKSGTDEKEKRHKRKK